MSVSIFPVFIAALAAFAVTAPDLDLASRLGAAHELNAALLLLLAISTFYPAIALLERMLPYQRRWNRSDGDLRTDIVYLAFSSPVTSGVFQATVGGSAAAVAPKLAASLGTNLWPAGAPLVAQIFLAILIAELGHYWFHRVSHERPLVWRLHATHHSSKRLYWGNATRFHPFDLFALISLQSVPLLLLGIPESTFLGYSLFASVYGQLQHANIRLSTPRWLDWVFSSPGLHRWHHSPDPGEGNHNYGAILSSWDLVFGTFFRPCERTFGGKVGLSGLPEFPTRYVAQLASPFRWPPGR